MKKITVYITVVILFMAAACSPDKGDLTLGPLPEASFTVTPVPGKINTFLLSSTSNNTTQWQWTFGDGSDPKMGLANDTVYYNYKGSYEVKLLAMGRGGIDSTFQTVVVAEDDPSCVGLKALLTGCGERVWKLNPDAGAFKVGPGPDLDSWWGSSTGEVNVRSCAFNDEYKFKADAAGTFIYDNKGDFFSDNYLGNKSGGCEPAANLTGEQAFWGSGNFSYTIIGNAGVKKLGQLRLNGKGAHIGLPKVHNGGETESGPVRNNLVYDILEIKENVNNEGYATLKLGVHIGGEGWWTFTIRSF